MQSTIWHLLLLALCQAPSPSWAYPSQLHDMPATPGRIRGGQRQAEPRVSPRRHQHLNRVDVVAAAVVLAGATPLVANETSDDDILARTRRIANNTMVLYIGPLGRELKKARMVTVLAPLSSTFDTSTTTTSIETNQGRITTNIPFSRLQVESECEPKDWARAKAAWQRHSRDASRAERLNGVARASVVPGDTTCAANGTLEGDVLAPTQCIANDTKVLYIGLPGREFKKARMVTVLAPLNSPTDASTTTTSVMAGGGKITTDIPFSRLQVESKCDPEDWKRAKAAWHRATRERQIYRAPHLDARITHANGDEVLHTGFGLSTVCCDGTINIDDMTSYYDVRNSATGAITREVPATELVPVQSLSPLALQQERKTVAAARTDSSPSLTPTAERLAEIGRKAAADMSEISNRCPCAVCACGVQTTDTTQIKLTEAPPAMWVNKLRATAEMQLHPDLRSQYELRDDLGDVHCLWKTMLLYPESQYTSGTDECSVDVCDACNSSLSGSAKHAPKNSIVSRRTNLAPCVRPSNLSRSEVSSVLRCQVSDETNEPLAAKLLSSG